MSKSIANPQKLRGRLMMAGKSLPKIAAKHGVNYWTLYAALHGKRPGKCEKVQRALREVHRA